MQQRQRHLSANRRHDAGHHAQQRELRPQRGAQQRLPGPQRAPDHQLLITLTHPDLYLRQQQQNAAGGDQNHHHLKRAAYLGQHLANLLQNRADIQQADGGEFAVELREHPVAVIPAEAGQPALRLAVKRPLREDKEEVRPQALPVDFTHAGHLRAKVLSIPGKGHAIAELDAQTLRQPLFNRHLARLRRPATGNQRIMIRTLAAPGEVKLPVQGFIFIALRHLTVNLRQAGAHDGVELGGAGLMFGEEGFHRHHLLRRDVNQEIVRTFRRQLLLPAVKQIAAQHQQQRQQHKRQRKGRQLAQGRPRLTQQTVHRQAQRQRF